MGTVGLALFAVDRCAGHITEEEFEELLLKRVEELRRLTNGDGRHTLNRKKRVQRQ